MSNYKILSISKQQIMVNLIYITLSIAAWNLKLPSNDSSVTQWKIVGIIKVVTTMASCDYGSFVVNTSTTMDIEKTFNSINENIFGTFAFKW